jgi:hypothetical protein
MRMRRVAQWRGHTEHLLSFAGGGRVSKRGFEVCDQLNAGRGRPFACSTTPSCSASAIWRPLAGLSALGDYVLSHQCIEDEVACAEVV